MTEKNGLPVIIKWIDSKNPQDIEDALYVRRDVFVKEQKVPETEEYDEFDIKSDHVVVYVDEKPIATGRIFTNKGTWFIGRVSVLKEYRKKQIGKIVMEKLLEKAVESGAEEIHIHAQTQAADFYEKFGFKSYGKTFFEANIEHISMKRGL